MRLGKSTMFGDFKWISIHALTRSATTHDLATVDGLEISIHALTRSATQSQLSPLDQSIDFNPRTHKECDIQYPGIGIASKIISIHALTRSATCVGWYDLTALNLFQSTHSQGVRPQYLDHDFNSFLNIGLQINLP